MLVRQPTQSLGAFDGKTQLSGTGTGGPPDPTLAAGRMQVVQVANNAVAIFDKSDVSAAPTVKGLDGLLGHPGDYNSDPRVLYESATGWFWLAAMVRHEDANKNDIYYISLVHTVAADDPFGVWQPADIATDTTILDQPQLAVGPDEVVVSWSPDGGNNDKRVLIQRSSLDGANGPKDVHAYVGHTSRAYMALARSEEPPNPIIGVGHQLGSDTLAVVRFQVSATDTGTRVHATTNQVKIATMRPPPDAKQPGDTQLLQTDDDRVESAYLSADGHLWVAGNDTCTPPGDDKPHSCLRIVELKLSTDSVQLLQDFDIGQGGTDLMYPAIVRGSSTHGVLIAHEVSGENQFLTAGITMIPGGTAAPSVPGVDYRVGDGPVGSGHASDDSLRCGDYLGVDTDPFDAGLVWGVGIYASTNPDAYGIEVQSFQFP